MNRERGAGVKTGPSEGLWTRGPLIRARVRRIREGGYWEKRQTDERGGGEKRKRSFFWGRVSSYSLVSDAEIDSERGQGWSTS